MHGCALRILFSLVQLAPPGTPPRSTNLCLSDRQTTKIIFVQGEWLPSNVSAQLSLSIYLISRQSH